MIEDIPVEQETGQVGSLKEAIHSFPFPDCPPSTGEANALLHCNLFSLNPMKTLDEAQFLGFFPGKRA